MSDNDKKTEYEFGGIEEFNLQQIEEEILNESIYLDVFAGSDLRFKKEVQPLIGDLDKITALKGYSYKYKTEDFPQNEFATGEQLGVMAQEVEKVYPGAVKMDKDGYRFVNYSQLTPGLIGAVSELKELVGKQSEMIAELKAEIADLKK